MFAAGKSASSKPLTYTFVGSLTSTNNGPGISFGNFTLAESGLAIVVFTSLGDLVRGVSSITIGGTTMSQIDTGGGARNVAIGYVSKAAGTHNVTATLSGTRSTSFVSHIASVWLVKDALSLSPRDSGTLAPASNTSASVTLDYHPGGFAVYGFCLDVTGAVSWSNATEQLDTSLSTKQHSHAFKHPTTAVTNHTETVSSWTLNVSTMAGISFR